MPFGIVTNTKPGFIKASVPEMEDYETDWLPIVSPLANTDKQQFNVAIDTQVFILFEYDKYGDLISQVCVGATYNDEDTAPFSKDKSGTIFSDDAEISYDKTAKVLTIKSAATLNLNGINIVLGNSGDQALVNLTTLKAYLTVVNTILTKIPTAPTGGELSALNAAFALASQGIATIKTPLV